MVADCRRSLSSRFVNSRIPTSSGWSGMRRPYTSSPLSLRPAPAPDAAPCPTSSRTSVGQHNAPFRAWKEHSRARVAERLAQRGTALCDVSRHPHAALPGGIGRVGQKRHCAAATLRLEALGGCARGSARSWQCGLVSLNRGDGNIISSGRARDPGHADAARCAPHRGSSWTSPRLSQRIRRARSARSSRLVAAGRRPCIRRG